MVRPSSSEVTLGCSLLPPWASVSPPPNTHSQGCCEPPPARLLSQPWFPQTAVGIATSLHQL